MSNLLRVTRGNDLSFIVDVATVAGNPDDLTGLQAAWCTIKSRRQDSDEDALWQGVIGSGVEVDGDPEDGKLAVEVPRVVFVGVPVGRIYYDVKIKAVDGSETTVVNDCIDVLREVTQAV